MEPAPPTFVKIKKIVKRKANTTTGTNRQTVLSRKFAYSAQKDTL